MQIELFEGDRRALLALFELADDSASQISACMGCGEVLVARERHEVLGEVLIVDATPGGEAEIRSLAVADSHRSRGVGGQLMAAALARAKAHGARRARVCTAAAATDTLRFYQRCGFRMRRIVRDAFTPEMGYPPGLSIQGIPLRDQVVLDIDLDA